MERACPGKVSAGINLVGSLLSRLPATQLLVNVSLGLGGGY